MATAKKATSARDKKIAAKASATTVAKIAANTANLDTNADSLSKQLKATEDSIFTQTTLLNALQASPVSVTITAASASGGVVTYTAANALTAGQTISITGLSTAAFNLSNVKIASATSSAFTVTNAATGTAVTGASGVGTTSVDAKAVSTAKTTLSGLNTKKNTLYTQLVAAHLADQNLKSNNEQSAADEVVAAADKVTNTAIGAYKTKLSNGGGDLLYNASAVNEAYFSSNSNFVNRVQGPNNRPSAVQQASDLWTQTKANKGMIVTSEQVLRAWNSGSNPANTANLSDNHNYGFQFQYNPGTVAMSYFTAPNVDVTLMTSGQEMFNLAGVSGSQGSISFQVVINRIFDMQYFDNYGALKPGVSLTDIYAVPPIVSDDPTALDAKALYEHGTMYDVESLLRVLMGTTMNSYLRGTKTADMGWLPALPVELHLGKEMRYLGTINSLNLNHIIFDSRMVPLFSTLDIAFARLPDYPADTTSKDDFMWKNGRKIYY
jgi:hypothetical protein